MAVFLSNIVLYLLNNNQRALLQSLQSKPVALRKSELRLTMIHFSNNYITLAGFTANECCYHQFDTISQIILTLNPGHCSLSVNVC